MWDTLQQRFLASVAGRWYAGREPSEQRIVLILGAVIAVTVLWLAVWKPVSDWRAVAHNRYQIAQADLDWLRANENRARAVSGSAGAAGPARSLVRIIPLSAEAQGIKINRLQPESNDVLSVSLQGQPFNDVIRWIHQLEVNNGVTVQRLTVDAEGRPGLVNAQIRLM
jgi:general secretion pathway protein M